LEKTNKEKQKVQMFKKLIDEKKRIWERKNSEK